jgi:hypothetical protein
MAVSPDAQADVAVPLKSHAHGMQPIDSAQKLACAEEVGLHCISAARVRLRAPPDGEPRLKRHSFLSASPTAQSCCRNARGTRRPPEDGRRTTAAASI